ncbi:NADPH:quinone reductase-like Zn-dependent oxidoreductase [Granulicella aggregans]|uniref:NADPH:quinone reductase-like Zn-dependent oxidoreductase n=1 Tax=Granulicella aggregans TaxID=474949 RepID=A0A7W7ZKR2_9BACT|nr:NAD(P)-dependent alcohol dehydrogenase [Granulicella aggregans]MBB5061513.1 NADPH:quinone reductase-like Zn-dependent oxidoreductase [Granulicella aggregans]
MQAVVYRRYGSPDVLEFQEIPKPTPAEGEVLIRVHAASVNPYDWHFLRGTPSFIRLFTGMSRPKSPRLGADVAGTIEAVGAKVAQFMIGDEVFGTAKGSFAEYACAVASQLAVKPQEISFEQAACLPIAGITALQGLRDKGDIQTGQAILINGAAGGVGTFAVQIAKSLGVRVTGVCSTGNIDFLRSIGADEVIDYTREDFARSTKLYDLLFDLVGNRSLADYLRALHPRGTYISCGGGGPENSTWNLLSGLLANAIRSRFVSQKMPGLFAKVNSGDLATLAALVQAGKVVPVVNRTYALREIAEAVRQVESGHVRGKVVIAIA